VIIQNKGKAMKNIDNTPLWVSLAYASVPSRKVALWLIAISVLFTLYCVPWVKFSSNPMIEKVFLLHDWWWFVSMIPLIIWYWLSLKWVDKNNGWE
jgi:hypothetical protein